jgi:N utilization substance protein B
MATRRRAREIVLQMLYEADVNPWRDDDACLNFILGRLSGRKALAQFSQNLLRGTLLHRDQIDRELAKHTTNWSLHRMAVTDRNILRLGAYEILVAGTPGRVAINEAVDLARRYGEKNSARFVNGVLDKLMHSQHVSAATEGP